MPKPPRRFSRRQILGTGGFLAAGAVLIACGGANEPASLERPPPIGADDEPDPVASADGEGAGASGQIGPAADAPAELETEPIIWVVPKDVPQGNTFVVAIDAPGAGFASVAFEGRVFSLLREGARFFTLLGVDALTPIGPLPVVISVADGQGRPVVQIETLVNITDSNWQIENVALDESNSELLDPEIRAEDDAARLPVQARETPERHWNDLFDPPLADSVITSNYGLLRSYNFKEPTEYHSGLDYAGDNGDAVVAPNAGVVAWVGQTRRRGNGLIIDHGGGVFSGFYHMSEVVVAEGTVVNAKDFIGRVGATGLATGPHLHWEVVVHGVTVDPIQWIRTKGFPNPIAEFDPLDAVQARNQRAP